MLKIAVIVGSTRPGRVGESVAKWVYEVANKRSDAEFDLVDIKDFNLPLLDEHCTKFKPATHHEKSVNQMLDQLIAWSGALRTLRVTAR